ncbi:hypothetical protein PMI05_04121, partial [Brevibacillus sp. BC25]
GKLVEETGEISEDLRDTWYYPLMVDSK